MAEYPQWWNHVGCWNGSGSGVLGSRHIWCSVPIIAMNHQQGRSQWGGSGRELDRERTNEGEGRVDEEGEVAHNCAQSLGQVV